MAGFILPVFASGVFLWNLKMLSQSISSQAVLLVTFLPDVLQHQLSLLKIFVLLPSFFN
jgi:hypothetical protein